MVKKQIKAYNYRKRMGNLLKFQHIRGHIILEKLKRNLFNLKKYYIVKDVVILIKLFIQLNLMKKMSLEMLKENIVAVV